jgi:hypothetical protein
VILLGKIFVNMVLIGTKPVLKINHIMTANGILVGINIKILFHGGDTLSTDKSKINKKMNKKEIRARIVEIARDYFKKYPYVNVCPLGVYGNEAITGTVDDYYEFFAPELYEENYGWDENTTDEQKLEAMQNVPLLRGIELSALIDIPSEEGAVIASIHRDTLSFAVNTF